MRPAAVGFQCPECVKEGARTTRSARTAYGGTRSNDPTLTSKVLIGLNVAVWLLILVTGGPLSPWVDRLALRPDGGTFRTGSGLVVYLHGVADGAWWQPLTSMFAHVEVFHIGFNMLALYVLGPQLEAALGRARFLSLYLLSGLVGSALVYWASPPLTPTLGASGAIFGLLGGLLVVALKVKADLRQLGVWIGINFVITILVPHVSWQGHLGGFLGGVVIAAILVYAPRQRRTLVQVLGVGAVAVLMVLSVVARTLVLT